MKKKILNIGWLFSMLAMVVFGFASCDEDRDSNPTLDLSHVDEGFVLNVPAYAANNTYDLAAATNLTLTTSQPNYGGVPYAVRYYVQVAIDQTFLTDTTATHKELSTSYTTAKMAVDASELNTAVVALYQAAFPDTDVPSTMPVYIRLRAVIDNTGGMGQTYSNIITLPSVKATYVAPKAVLPDQLYVVGSSIQTAWTSWKVVPQVYGLKGNYYTMVFVPAGGSFKWGTFNNDWRGYNRFRNVTDNANAGISESTDGNHNIIVAKGGWYVLHFVGEIVGNNIMYDLNVYPGAAYIIGPAAGGSWTDGDASWALTAPSDQTGQWVSPAFTGAGELRAYIKVPGIDWWRTEYTIYKGACYWRTVDIPSNWATNVGADYSVQTVVGQKLYVNFDMNTAEVK
jgi:hypothetical protein